MSADPFRHSLVHVFLEEELGGQSPPDLARAILDKAFGDESHGAAAGPKAVRRAFPRWSVPVALAASIAIALTAWMLLPAGYPGLTISGDYQIDSGDGVQRGSTISTQDGSAVLELGGYCRIEIEPGTTLRIDGTDYSEQLFVDVGTAVCSVDSNVGRFAVLSELGSASVRGTKFTVRVEGLGGRRRMWVKVTEGSVEVNDGSDRDILQVGQERIIGAAERKKPKTAAATKPDDNIGIGIESIDPGVNPGLTSSSDGDRSVLQEQIRASQKRLKEIEAGIRKLRDENQRLQKQLDGRNSLPESGENSERRESSENKPIERQSSKPE